MIFLVAFVLVCYGTGAAFIEGFVNYPSWRFIGEAEFRTYHQFISPRVLAFLVAPLILGTAFTLFLLWTRPPSVPSWMVWTALAAQTVMWISTATIQVPIQIELGTVGRDLVLLERLIITNLWLRRLPMAINGVLFLWMALRVMDVSVRGLRHDQRA